MTAARTFDAVVRDRSCPRVHARRAAGGDGDHDRDHRRDHDGDDDAIKATDAATLVSGLNAVCARRWT